MALNRALVAIGIVISGCGLLSPSGRDVGDANTNVGMTDNPFDAAGTGDSNIGGRSNADADGELNRNSGSAFPMIDGAVDSARLLGTGDPGLVTGTSEAGMPNPPADSSVGTDPFSVLADAGPGWATLVVRPEEMHLSSITPNGAQQLYDSLRTRKTERGQQLSVDSHRNILAEAKTFLGWCVGKKWIRQNPLEHVQGVGKRRHGKEQLRIAEARRWIGKAIEYADDGEAGAVAALTSLLMGMRASEIISRVVRDLDDEGRLLWIPETKTEAGRRTLQVPELLQPYLVSLAEGKGPYELLFGQHWRDWPREWVQRICVKAKVPKVTAHGMRGLHSTLAVESGMTGHAVAAALGHESSKTTYESYVHPSAAAHSQQRKVLKVLAGGSA